MGFADLPIAEIAAEYDLLIEEVCHSCEQFGIAYKTQETRLALEDAKAIISKILSKSQGSVTLTSRGIKLNLRLVGNAFGEDPRELKRVSFAL
jgi:hypothetical protein